MPDGWSRLAQDLDLERVKPGLKLIRQGIIDAAMGINPAQRGQLIGQNLDLEMGLPAFTPPGMTIMLGRDIADRQRCRAERLLQPCGDPVLA